MLFSKYKGKQIPILIDLVRELVNCFPDVFAGAAAREAVASAHRKRQSTARKQR